MPNTDNANLTVPNGNLDSAQKKPQKKHRFSSKTRFRVSETILRTVHLLVPCIVLSVFLSVFQLSGLSSSDPFSVTLSTLLACMIFFGFYCFMLRQSFFLLYGHRSYYITNLCSIGIFSALNLGLYKGMHLLFANFLNLQFTADLGTATIDGGAGLANFIYTWMFTPVKFFRFFPMLREWGWSNWLNNGYAALFFDITLLLVFIVQTVLMRIVWIRKPKEFKEKNNSVTKRRNKRRKEAIPTDI